MSVAFDPVTVDEQNDMGRVPPHSTAAECWCPQPGPCHAHVLAEMADRAAS